MDLITNKSRIPYRDPRVKPEDDIVWNSRIPNLEFLEIASVALFPRNDAENSRIPKLEFPNKNTP